jgi:hypothetical protein
MGIGVVFRGWGKKGRIKKAEGRGKKEEGGLGRRADVGFIWWGSR